MWCGIWERYQVVCTCIVLTAIEDLLLDAPGGSQEKFFLFYRRLLGFNRKVCHTVCHPQSLPYNFGYGKRIAKVINFCSLCMANGWQTHMYGILGGWQTVWQTVWQTFGMLRLNHRFIVNFLGGTASFQNFQGKHWQSCSTWYWTTNTSWTWCVSAWALKLPIIQVTKWLNQHSTKVSSWLKSTFNQGAFIMERNAVAETQVTSKILRVQMCGSQGHRAWTFPCMEQTKRFLGRLRNACLFSSDLSYPHCRDWCSWRM